MLVQEAAQLGRVVAAADGRRQLLGSRGGGGGARRPLLGLLLLLMPLLLLPWLLPPLGGPLLSPRAWWEQLVLRDREAELVVRGCSQRTRSSSCVMWQQLRGRLVKLEVGGPCAGGSGYRLIQAQPLGARLVPGRRGHHTARADSKARSLKFKPAGITLLMTDGSTLPQTLS